MVTGKVAVSRQPSSTTIPVTPSGIDHTIVV